jgi:tRNA-specific adenosine deaminase 3
LVINDVNSIIRQLIPNDGGLDLQHLRRFAKKEFVPEIVRSTFFSSCAIDEGGDPLPELFLIIGSTNVIPDQTVLDALSPTLPGIKICSIQVPLIAPTSQEQASLWSTKYWPIVYKKSNPFGPHPSIVSRAEDEISTDVEKWMNLASKAAEESNSKGIGEAW